MFMITKAIEPALWLNLTTKHKAQTTTVVSFFTRVAVAFLLHLGINWFLKGVNYLFNYMSLIIPGLVTTEFYTARYKVLHLYKYQAEISQKLTLLIATKSYISINTKQKYPKN
jgi:hypothetical protein